MAEENLAPRTARVLFPARGGALVTARPPSARGATWLAHGPRTHYLFGDGAKPRARRHAMADKKVTITYCNS
ncbi:hypothetical protein MFU01_18500 [Myxococcus fulvus]|uniref:Uncharacterized protein n=1 Tax=Myxococcus fulvus TaxID=33 RepID=A0A511SZS7_MYXFU|nr:hypothetical protein MFU01_18500 [Myxococcus fulvus]